jgi:trehalose-6-phosphate synthase
MKRISIGSDREPLVAYANRLPVTRSQRGWALSSGGLASALRPALESRGGVWVGWDGGAHDMPRRVAGLDVELLPVALSRREVEDYYRGFSNRTLWLAPAARTARTARVRAPLVERLP